MFLSLLGSMAPFSRLLPLKPSCIHRHIYTAPLSNRQKVQNALAFLQSNDMNSAKEILNLCHAATQFHNDIKPLNIKSSSTSNAIGSLLHDLKKHSSLLSSFLNELKTRPDLQNEDFLCYSITLYGQAGMLYQAILTFEEMVKLGIPPSTKSLNALLGATLHLNKDAAKEYFSSFRRIHGIKQCVDTYKHQWGFQKSLFFTILQEMEEQGCKPDSTTYNLISALLYKEEHYAAKLIHFMDKKGLPLNVGNYNFGIASLCKRKKPFKAKELFDKISLRGMKPDADSYRHLIPAFGDISYFGDVQQLFIDMNENGVDPDRNCYEAIAEYIESEEDLLILVEMCMLKDWFPSVFFSELSTMRRLVVGLAENGRYKDLKEMIDRMEELGLRPGLPIYNIAVENLCGEGDGLLARKLFERMISRGVKLNVDTSLHLFRIFKKTGHVEGIRKLYNNMRENSVELDEFSYEIIYECLPQSEISESLSQSSDNKCIAEDRDSQSLFQDSETVVRTAEKCVAEDAVSQASKNQVSKKRFRCGLDYTNYETLPSHLSRILNDEEALEKACRGKERYTKIVNLLKEIKESCGERRVHHDCMNVACCLLSFGICYQFGSPIL